MTKLYIIARPKKIEIKKLMSKKQLNKKIRKLEEEIDHCSSEKIRKRIDYEIEIHIPKKVVFDLQNVNFMDSSGIGLLIGRYKLASMLGRKV